MKIGSLCSGYGGLDLAVQDHFGATVAWCAENDPHPATVYKRHWPDAKNHGDITTTDWATLPPVDIITAGYPCQPFSRAGMRRGTNDERHLWPNVADAIRTLRPARVVLENVTAHRSLGFDVVLGDLASMGYDARWGVVRASDAGAPHSRARIFLVAAAHASSQRHGAGQDHRPLGQVGGQPEGSGRQTGAAWEVTGNRTAEVGGQCLAEHASTVATTTPRSAWTVSSPSQPTSPDLSPSILVESQATGLRSLTTSPSGWGDYAPAIQRWALKLGRPAPAALDDIGTSPALSEWLMGLPAGWVTEPTDGAIGDLFGGWKSDEGVPRTAQLKMLGNGVVPQQAALALQLLDGDDA